MKRKVINSDTNISKKQKKIQTNGHKLPKQDDWTVEAISDDASDYESFENEYKAQIAYKSTKKDKLPIKTNQGLLQQVESESEPEEEFEDDPMEDVEEEEEDEPEAPKSVSAMEIYSLKNKTFEEKKIQIGSLSASILENPDEKIHNFKTLLNIVNNKDTAGLLSIKKLVIVSLTEVFKDLLPSYKLTPNVNKEVKLKKETLKLERYETALLQYYKKFLQVLEQTALILIKKKGAADPNLKPIINLAEIAVTALCDLLQTHPYFNYSENIAQTVVPFLNNKNNTVQEKTANTCKTIFKEDKKGELTLKILRLINQYVKKHNNVHIDMIEVLLSLRIKDVNLDDERANLIKQKKLQSHKSNVMNLSKMERKRKAKLGQLEKELLEAKAEENKQMKKKHQTEITKLAFGLFFRILKTSKNSKLLGICLKGISKFAHCLNVEFYVDLINILNELMKAEWLEFREQQQCIQTVFVILSQQGEIINLDPTKFYVAAYENLLKVHGSRNYNDFGDVLDTLKHALIARHKKISVKRMASFMKRLTTISLQVLHNGTLGCFGIVKTLLQLNKALDILLDIESSPGDGKYLPELNDPEYCNASATALYELILLSKHYHPTVQEYSKYIAHGVPAAAENPLAAKFGRTNAEDLYKSYDTSEMAFYPPVPIPKKENKKYKVRSHQFMDLQLKETCRRTLKQSRLTFLN